jgi:N-acyl-D-aspartate/D-glutamate deacylase
MGRANRQATPEEISKMQELVAQGMRAGAVGSDGGIR